MSRHTKVKRITAPKIRARKGAEPIVCLTAYSAPIAKLMDPYVDLILVGDSAANVVHGFDTTIGITLEHMIMHGQAVMRGSERACVVVDLPFGSYEESPKVAYRSAARVMKETGCSAVKLEGGVQMADTIRFLVDRGIPVMAHVGLRPQAVQTMGGYRTSGRDRTEWPQIEADALAVQEAGAFAVVLEGMAAALADRLTDLIEIPTIGIGASARCDGQILVVDDMLGLTERVPCFVRKYADMAGTAEAAIRAYADDVKGRTFPAEEHTFQMRKKA